MLLIRVYVHSSIVLGLLDTYQNTLLHVTNRRGIKCISQLHEKQVLNLSNLLHHVEISVNHLESLIIQWFNKNYITVKKYERNRLSTYQTVLIN